MDTTNTISKTLAAHLLDEGDIIQTVEGLAEVQSVCHEGGTMVGYRDLDSGDYHERYWDGHRVTVYLEHPALGAYYARTA